MIVTVIPAATMAISLAQAKAHCRVDDTDSDAVITGFIRAATEYVSERTGLTLQPTTLQYRADRWSCLGGWRSSWWLQLPRSPVRDVTAITYFDVDGIEQTIAPSSYSWEPTNSGAYIWFGKTYSLPALEAGRPSAVRVMFEAGFNDPADNDTGSDPSLILPERLQQAMLLLIGHWFENRETVTIAATFSEVPVAMEALIETLRVFR